MNRPCLAWKIWRLAPFGVFLLMLALPAMAVDAPPSKSVSDPVFDRYVDLEELASAWEEQDADALTDVAVDLAEGERVLYRSHNAVTADQVFVAALKIATLREDKAVLARLATVVDASERPELARRIGQARKLAAVSRGCDPALIVQADRVPLGVYFLLQGTLEAITQARIADDREALKAIVARVPELSKLTEAQRKALLKEAREAMDAMPSEADPVAAALNKLSAESRGHHGGGGGHHGGGHSGGGHGGASHPGGGHRTAATPHSSGGHKAAASAPASKAKRATTSPKGKSGSGKNTGRKPQRSSHLPLMHGDSTMFSHLGGRARRTGGGRKPGRTSTNPGRTSTNPGRIGRNPGRTGTNPGRTGTNPGRTGTNPGRTGTNPGRTGTNPGRTGKNPGGGGKNTSGGGKDASGGGKNTSGGGKNTSGGGKDSIRRPPGGDGGKNTGTPGGGKDKKNGGKDKKNGGKDKKNGGKDKKNGGKDKKDGGKDKKDGGKDKKDGGKDKDKRKGGGGGGGDDGGGGNDGGGGDDGGGGGGGDDGGGGGGGDDGGGGGGGGDAPPDIDTDIPVIPSNGGFVIGGSDSVEFTRDITLSPGDTLVSVGGVRILRGMNLQDLVDRAYQSKDRSVVVKDGTTGVKKEYSLPEPVADESIDAMDGTEDRSKVTQLAFLFYEDGKVKRIGLDGTQWGVYEEEGATLTLRFGDTTYTGVLGEDGVSGTARSGKRTWKFMVSRPDPSRLETVAWNQTVKDEKVIDAMDGAEDRSKVAQLAFLFYKDGKVKRIGLDGTQMGVYQQTGATLTLRFGETTYTGRFGEDGVTGTARSGKRSWNFMVHRPDAARNETLTWNLEDVLD